MVKLEFESRPSIAHAETLGKLPISYQKKKKSEVPKKQVFELTFSLGQGEVA